MSEVLKTPEASPKSSNKETITHFEERLKRARLRLARAKKELHVQSMRERSRRERDVGKIVLRLIDDDKLDGPVVALIRDEVRAICRSPAQVSAFRGTPLGE
jgi:phosphoenolpyruvate-protein kinase (PTS system EI component)